MTSKFTIEPSFKIFDNDTGAYINVSTDLKGLGMCRISYHDAYATETPEIFMDREMIPHLVKALEMWHAQTEQD